MFRAFTSHPQAVGESYTEHMGVALGFSGKLFVAAAAALVHALIPALCERTASRMVGELHAKTAKRAAMAATSTEHRTA